MELKRRIQATQADMKNVRLKQFGLALCLALSLLISPVSACACSHHHPENAESEISSHHQHSEAAVHHHDSEADNAAQSVTSQDECCCLETAPKVSAKSENIKIEKQKSAMLSLAPVEITFVSQTISVESAFTRKFYLTDSFYNLTPGRAPPAL